MNDWIWVEKYAVAGHFRRPDGWLESRLPGSLRRELAALRARSADLEAQIRTQVDRNLSLTRPSLRERDEDDALPDITPVLQQRPEDVIAAAERLIRMTAPDLDPLSWGYVVLKFISLFYNDKPFTLPQIYIDAQDLLERLYPDNRDVTATLRKTLQMLRDGGGCGVPRGKGKLVRQVSWGVWCRNF